MQNIKALFREEKINKTIENLKNNGFDVVLVNNVEEAEKLTLQEIPKREFYKYGRLCYFKYDRASTKI